MRQVWPENVGNARHEILPACLQWGVTERREGVRFVEAVVTQTPPDKDTMKFVKALVETHGELISVQLARRGIGKSPGACIRIRDEFREVHRLLRKSACRYDVSGERRESRPAGRIDTCRNWIHDGDWVTCRITNPSENATLHRRGRYWIIEDQTLALPHSFVARKKESFVASIVKSWNQDGPSERSAELVALEDFTLTGEEVTRVEFVVAQEFKEAAMNCVRTRLRRTVQQSAGMAEFRRVSALLYLEFLKGVNRCLDERAALVVIGNIDPIHQEGGLPATHPADRRARAEVGADAQEVTSTRQQRRAGSEPGQLVVAAPVERQVDDLRVRHHVPERAGFRVEQWRGRSHLDR